MILLISLNLSVPIFLLIIALTLTPILANMSNHKNVSSQKSKLVRLSQHTGLLIQAVQHQ